MSSKLFSPMFEVVFLLNVSVTSLASISCSSSGILTIFSQSLSTIRRLSSSVCSDSISTFYASFSSVLKLLLLLVLSLSIISPSSYSSMLLSNCSLGLEAAYSLVFGFVFFVVSLSFFGISPEMAMQGVLNL